MLVSVTMVTESLYDISDVGIHELLRDQTSLESLVLSKLAMTGAGLQGFASPLLEKVSLRGCGNVLSEGQNIK